MNIIFKAVLLLSVSYGLINADSGITELLVEAPSAERIESAKQELVGSEKQRDNARYFAGGLVALGGLYMMYRMGSDSTVPSEAVQKLIEAHKQDLEAAKQQSQPNNNEPFLPWCWDKMKAAPGRMLGVMKAAPGGMLGVGYMLAKQLLYMKVLSDGARFLHGMFPHAGKLAHYLFASRTIVWCIEIHTQFCGALTMLMNSTNAISDESDDMIQSKTNVSNALNYFIHEVEKVMGYMSLVTDQLKPEDQVIKTIAKHGRKRVEDILQRLVRKANEFIAAEDNLADMKTALVHEFRESTYALVNHLETFQNVQVCAGYDDTSDLKIFKNIKAFIKPEEQEAASPVVPDELTQLMRQLLPNIL